MHITKIITILRNFHVFATKIANFKNHQKTVILKLAVFVVKTWKFRKIVMIFVICMWNWP